MREACSRVVTALGGLWPYLGWGLFLALITGPLFVGEEIGPGVLLVGVAVLLTPIWWITDLVDQQVPAWMVLGGLAMIVLGYMTPYPPFAGPILLIAAWVIYWTRVRE